MPEIYLAHYTVSALDGSITLIDHGNNTVPFEYDDQGNIIDDGHFEYTWDLHNRLVKAKDKTYTTGATTPEYVYYLYDALGRRVARLYSNTATGLENTVTIYDGLAPIAEYDFDDNQGLPGKLQRQYYYADGINQLAQVDEFDATGTWQASYVPLTDDRGTLMGVIDGSTGQLIEKIYSNSTGLCKSYNPDGTENFRSGSTFYNRGRSKYIDFGWCGMVRDEFTGKYHTHYREYDPLHGRWLSEDPAGMVDGMNPYHAYMGVNGVDEDGRFISGAITLGFTAWDTTMWKMGRISDGEYAFRMGVNATALAADALSGGFGGGLAVRSASLLGRAGSAANRVYRSSRALRTAGVGIRTLARTKNAQRIGTVGKVLNPIASVGEVGMGLYGVQQGISQGDIIGGIDSGRMTASTLRGFARSWHLITAPPKKLYPKARKSFYRVARSDKFREAFGAFDRDNATGRKEYADFLRMVRKAEFKKSNILQGGYAGLDNSKNIVLGLNPFYRNFQSSATHELIHLYRHYNNIMPFENEALMKGIYRYKAWKEEWQVIKQTYGRIK